MKIGLLDLLACPICKYWPIKLQIFTWETKENTFKKALDGISDITILKDLTKIIKRKDQFEDCININENYIQDDLIRYSLRLDEYIKKFNEILKNLNYITISNERIQFKVHEKVNEIYKNFLSMENVDDEQKLKQFILDQLPNIYLVNWYFQRAEINDGIMFCDKCKRWYPISETLPHMKPDNLRIKKEEVKFLKKWKNLIPEDILSEGKPFNLKN
ncbi:MAG: Trm112 family protein [Candidatus Helarchaeota archaeon]